MKKMFRRMGIAAVAAGLVISMSGIGQAQRFLTDTRSVRCSGGIVRVNDDVFQVEERCGDPFRTFMRDSDEIWVYNFGRGRLVYYFTFFRDNLRRIQSQRCDLNNRDCVYMGR